VLVHKEDNHCSPGYRCDSANYVGEVNSSATAAFESTYKAVCGSGTRISGATLLGLEDEAICYALLEDVVFQPFTVSIAHNIRVSIYQLGDLNATEKGEPGIGYLSSFLHYFWKKRCHFIQTFDNHGYHIQIYDGAACIAQFHGSDASGAWKKTGVLKQHDGRQLFGLEHSTTQECLNQDRALKCTPDDWTDDCIMELAYNHYLKKRTASNISWKSFFNNWMQKHTIIELWSELNKFYVENYSFSDREKGMARNAYSCWMYKYNTLP
jgi:hypothetical protein